MFRIGGQTIPVKTLVLVVCDAAFIVVGLLVATAIRFHDLRAIQAYLYANNTYARFGLVVLVCQLALYYHDMYDFRFSSRRSEIFVRLLQAFGVSCLVLALLYYLAPELSLGRGIALLAALTILALTLGFRLILDATGFWHRRPENLLIVGTGAAGISLAREIGSRRELSVRVVGFLDEKGKNIGKSLVNPGIIGSVQDVESLVGRKKIDRVVLSLTERRGHTPVRQLLHLKFRGVPVEDVHSLYERITGRILLERLAPSWLIFSDGFRKSVFLLTTKRAMDIVVSLLAIILASPLIGAISLAIWLETRSPMFYRQMRVGLGGRPFEILKFRSMYQNAEDNGPRWATKHDPRVTRVGRFLRKYRLDELPQLFNVVRGEMSLVGPRPERPEFCTGLEQQIPLFSLRHSLRPGITGWAQIKYQYGSSVEETQQKLEYDLFYIKHLSITLDMAILFETTKVVLYGRGAK